MSSEVRSSFITIISLSLIVFALVITGLVSGLIPSGYPARPKAEESARVETQVQVAGTGAAVDGLAGAAIANPDGAVDQAVTSTTMPSALMAEAKPKNP